VSLDGSTCSVERRLARMCASTIFGETEITCCPFQYLREERPPLSPRPPRVGARQQEAPQGGAGSVRAGRRT
jgi:hypothetical protein